MSVKVTDKLFYFLPQTNKNHLSTSLPQFTKDTNSYILYSNNTSFGIKAIVAFEVASAIILGAQPAS